MSIPRSLLRGLLFIALSLFPVWTAPVHAILIAEESFDYPAEARLAGLNGGKGWAGPWFASPLNRQDNLIASSSLAFNGLKTGGNRMRQVGSDVRSFRRLDADRKEVAPFVVDGPGGKTFGKDGTTIWISFLASARSFPKLAYGGIHLCDGLGDLKKDPFGDKREHQRISLGRSNTSKGWYLGRVTNGGPGSGKWDSGIRADATVRFLVYRFDFKAGDETAYLFLDPAPGKEPDVKSAVLTADRVADFRFNTLSVGSGAEFDLDEIRIGTEFRDVAPPKESGD